MAEPQLISEESASARAPSGEESAHYPVKSGEVLDGKWRLESKLGEGGMGTVFLAHDLQLDRKVAVKLLGVALANDAELVMRFEREARMTAGLEHPNIVPVYAVGRFHTRPFMVMKALDGVTLHTLVRGRGPLHASDLLLLARQIASGLDFIHAKGFIHRDIKAANIIIAPDGLATILDFGILRPSRGAQAVTRTGLVMGTPHYMSPEQAKGIREIDHRSDLYAFAVLLFECAAGELPFESDNDLSIIQMQAHSAPPDLCERAPWVPRSVGDVIARALSKDPAARYQSAGELCRAVEAAYVDQAPLPLLPPLEVPAAALPPGASGAQAPAPGVELPGPISLEPGGVSPALDRAIASSGGSGPVKRGHQGVAPTAPLPSASRQAASEVDPFSMIDSGPALVPPRPPGPPPLPSKAHARSAAAGAAPSSPPMFPPAGSGSRQVPGKPFASGSVPGAGQVPLFSPGATSGPMSLPGLPFASGPMSIPGAGPGSMFAPVASGPMPLPGVGAPLPRRSGPVPLANGAPALLAEVPALLPATAPPPVEAQQVEAQQVEAPARSGSGRASRAKPIRREVLYAMGAGVGLAAGLLAFFLFASGSKPQPLNPPPTVETRPAIVTETTPPPVEPPPVETPPVEPPPTNPGEDKPEPETAQPKPSRPVRPQPQAPREPALAALGVRGMGQLRIVSTRKNETYWAKVQVDGEQRGNTPLALELKAGTHKVRLEREGFKAVERQIKVASGRSAVMRIELVP